LLKSDSQVLKGMLTLRVGYLILLIASELAMEEHLTQDEAYERLMTLSPFEIKSRLRHVLMDFQQVDRLVFQQESLHLSQDRSSIQWNLPEAVLPPSAPAGGWLRQRRRDGAVNRVEANFYPSVWWLLEHCPGIIVGDKLEKRNRLESKLILAETTPGEKNFALQVEHLLNKISAPEYRQLNIEALMALAAFSEKNPELRVEEYLVLDVIVGHAVRLAWLDPSLPKPLVAGEPDLRSEFYAVHKAQAWSNFYETAPAVCGGYLIRSLQFLSQLATS
jgi:phosphorylase kinase alpha/beta subunit